MSATYDPDERWQEIRETALHRFSSLSVREVINRSTSWSLPDPYVCVVRVEDMEAGRVSEKAFVRNDLAERYVRRLEKKGVDYVIYNNEQMYCTMGFGSYDESEASN